MTRQILQAGAVFDGANVYRPGAVVIDGERIERTCAAAEAPEQPSTDYGPDAALLPGLIDCHVHLSFDATDNASQLAQEATDDTLLASMHRAAQHTLAAGVTTVRDLGDRDYLSLCLQEEFARNPRDGPELVCAGPPITTPDGHCWFLGGQTAPTPRALQSAVSARLNHGVDLIKVMANGGTLSRNQSTGLTNQFDHDQLVVIAKAARDHGLGVAVHAHTADAIASGIAAGAATIEHGGFRTPHGVRPDQDTLQAAANQHVTFSVTAGFDPAHVTDRIHRIAAAVQTGITQLRSAGVATVVGTDAGLGASKPHGVLPRAGAELTSAGYTPTQGLAALTTDAARVCGRSNTKGRLAAGYDADILAVNGDPLTDLAALVDPLAVYRRGVRL